MINAALVSEGGAFRGLYAGGVMDSLLKHKLYFDTTVAVSAGALCACNYVSRQYRRTLALNRIFRKDRRYVGREAMRNSGGVIDVGFVFSPDVTRKCPLDEEQFYHGGQKFYIVATDCLSGEPVYFEHNACDVPQALRASTAMPLLAPMVEIGDSLYLDGGISDYNPVEWAIRQGFEKVVVICSRPLTYEKSSPSPGERALSKLKYGKFPRLMDRLEENADLYNRTRKVLRELEAEGRIFVLQPSDPALSVSRLERDIDKLTAWYLLGEQDTDARIDELNAYLER